MNMTTKKLNTMIEEIELFNKYYPISNYDEFIINIKNNNIDLLQNNQKLVFDYFYSHISSMGDLISIEEAIKYKVINDIDYYKDVNDKFLSLIFNNHKLLYITDVDNTLTINGKLSIEKENYIKSFIDKDRIILSTGKNYQSIDRVSKLCKLDNSYSSTINGSVIYYKGNYEMVNGIGILSKDIIEEVERRKMDFLYYYVEDTYATHELDKANSDMMARFDEYYKINNNIDYNKVIKLLFFINTGDTQKEKEIQDLIKDNKELTCVRTASHCYEILRKDQHKGNTVKIIAQRLGIYYRCSIGFGDSMNDFKLLTHVGKGYVVSDCQKELKDFGFSVMDIDRLIDVTSIIDQYEKR